MILLVGLISVFFLMRLNAKLERRLESRRTIHSIVAPLYSYLGLLDHELQNETYHADRLVTQAVLDHVTELRAFLLQPYSKDLALWGTISWVQRLNNVLLGLEESLEAALQGEWDEHLVEIKEQVAHLNGFIKDTPELYIYASTPPGIVQRS